LLKAADFILFSLGAGPEFWRNTLQTIFNQYIALMRLDPAFLRQLLNCITVTVGSILLRIKLISFLFLGAGPFFWTYRI
jgi:hypothetical protein